MDERKPAEDASWLNDARFRLATERAPVMLWLGDTAGRCLYLNRAQREFWGVEPDDVSRFDWDTTVHPEDRDKLFGPLAEAMRNRESFSVETRFRRADGEYRIVHTDAQPRFDADGTFLGMIGVNVDLTEARRMEAALREETRALEVLNRVGTDVAAELELERVVQIVTDAGVELAGAKFGAFFYNVRDESGESYMLHVLSGASREDFAGFKMPRATGVFGPTYRGEAPVRSDDIIHDPRYGHTPPYHGIPAGHPPVRSYLAVPVRSRSGEVLGGLFFGHPEPGIFTARAERLIVGLAAQAAVAVDHSRLFEAAEREIAYRRRAEEALQQLNANLEEEVARRAEQLRKNEEALRHALKMEAVGKLTGGIAHDFNNLLQVIGGNLQLMSKYVAGNERAEQRLRTALGGVSRGAKLAAQLLAFGRRQALAPKVVNLARLVRNLDDMLRRALGEGIEIETVIAGGLWNSLVDPAQVENALLNLAINARDAMDGCGKLTVEAGNAYLDDRYAALQPDVAPGQYVMLAVTDTGCGMTPEIIEEAFEPFFTTKPEGQGTGLGLSQVYGFVKQSGGHVKIYSEPGQGTTVRIYLPRTRQEEDLAPDYDAGTVTTGGAEVVLVVEDDENVRDTAVEMLTDLGYRVLRAKDAQNALVILESGAAVDLLFTDVVMPGPLRSPELASKARERLPGLAVLFTSGYTENAIVHGGRLDDGVDLLSKPYSREALARKVREALQNARRRGGGRADASQAARPSGARPASQPLRVLLVEDVELIRMMTADMLTGLGHAVREAGNGAAALAMLEEEPADVLIADIGLPDMSGHDLAAEACRRNPVLRVVFASGDTTVGGPGGPALMTGSVLLQKPYNEAGLAAAIDAVLGNAAP